MITSLQEEVRALKQMLREMEQNMIGSGGKRIVGSLDSQRRVASDDHRTLPVVESRFVKKPVPIIR